MKRRFFSYFTASLLFACLCAIYMNVIVDDGPVRARALETLRTTADCGEKCKLDAFHGERNIVQERMEYDVAGKGHWVVICRRQFLIAGDHWCRATGGLVPEKP